MTPTSVHINREQTLRDFEIISCMSGLDACLLVTGHQRCSKRWVVRGEGKFRSVGGSEIG